MRVGAVVVAAGRGERFGAPKQFAELEGQTVAARSVAAARAVAEVVVLVVPAEYAGDGEGADHVVVGGASRSASVRTGLIHVGEVDVVVVHDAARPFATPDLFRAVVNLVRSGADGAVPGLAITDTVKRVTSDGDDLVVVATIDRRELVTVQTPQAFRTDVLVAAHVGFPEASDDAALVEAAGGRVLVTLGEAGNWKITYRGDLERDGRGRP